MKERNDKKSWEAYQKDGKKLMAEVMKKRKAIEEKYKDYERPKYGLDGDDPEAKELQQVTKWFNSETTKLRIKHGIK
jgi:hypothetical protein